MNEERVVIVTNGAYQCSFLTRILRNDKLWW
jgi:hypothetical protein